MLSNCLPKLPGVKNLQVGGSRGEIWKLENREIIWGKIGKVEWQIWKVFQKKKVINFFIAMRGRKGRKLLGGKFLADLKILPPCNLTECNPSVLGKRTVTARRGTPTRPCWGPPPSAKSWRRRSGLSRYWPPPHNWYVFTLRFILDSFLINQFIIMKMKYFWHIQDPFILLPESDSSPTSLITRDTILGQFNCSRLGDVTSALWEFINLIYILL